MSIPVLEADLEGWEVNKDRRKVRKERIQQELCVVEKGGKEINSARVDSKAVKMCLRFQVADVKKPWVSVKKIVEQGNKVGFGPKEDDKSIFNEETGNRLIGKASGRGSYLMSVRFVGGEKTEITVDSGAEENVCPWEWGKQFKMVDANSWTHFRDASGGTIAHHGRRDVQVQSPF